jgi:hypothetical protein
MNDSDSNAIHQFIGFLAVVLSAFIVGWFVLPLVFPWLR